MPVRKERFEFVTLKTNFDSSDCAFDFANIRRVYANISEAIYLELR